jgi:hypothetical protein
MAPKVVLFDTPSNPGSEGAANANNVKRPSRAGGRRRGARSKGRYSLTTTAKKYLKEREAQVQRPTFDNERRILNHIATEMQQLYGFGRTTTMNPEKWGELETQEKYVGLLNRVLLLAKNPIIASMKSAGYKFPKRKKRPIHAIREKDRQSSGQLRARSRRDRSGPGRMTPFTVSF